SRTTRSVVRVYRYFTIAPATSKKPKQRGRRRRSCRGAGKSRKSATKLQIPSAKLQRSCKLQSRTWSRRDLFEFQWLEFPWSLGFGIWIFARKRVRYQILTRLSAGRTIDEPSGMLNAF